MSTTERSNAARGCPDCELALRTREQFLHDDLGSHTFALVLPFVVVVGLSLALERLLR